MTNAEKFEEVFGVRPDIETMVLDCPTILQSECQYKEDEDMFCHCEKWWDEEYKEKQMIDIKPPEEEPKEDSWKEFWNRVNESVNEEKYVIPISETDVAVVKELHELNKTLKEILREMRKRKV